MQCKRAIELQLFSLRILIAKLISFICEAPVDKITGLPFFAIFLRKGTLVISADAILKNGIISSRKSIASSSKGVDRKPIPTCLQCSDKFI